MENQTEQESSSSSSSSSEESSSSDSDSSSESDSSDSSSDSEHEPEQNAEDNAKSSDTENIEPAQALTRPDTSHQFQSSHSSHARTPPIEESPSRTMIKTHRERESPQLTRRVRQFQNSPQVSQRPHTRWAPRDTEEPPPMRRTERRELYRRLHVAGRLQRANQNVRFINNNLNNRLQQIPRNNFILRRNNFRNNCMRMRNQNQNVGALLHQNWRDKVEREKEDNSLQQAQLELERQQFEQEKKSIAQNMTQMEATAERKLSHVAVQQKKCQQQLAHCEWWDKRLKEKEAKAVQDWLKYEKCLAAINATTRQNEIEDEKLKKKHLMLVHDEIRLEKEKQILLEFVRNCQTKSEVNSTPEISTTTVTSVTTSVTEVTIENSDTQSQLVKVSDPQSTPVSIPLRSEDQFVSDQIENSEAIAAIYECHSTEVKAGQQVAIVGNQNQNESVHKGSGLFDQIQAFVSSAQNLKEKDHVMREIEREQQLAQQKYWQAQKMLQEETQFVQKMWRMVENKKRHKKEEGHSSSWSSSKIPPNYSYESELEEEEMAPQRRRWGRQLQGESTRRDHSRREGSGSHWGPMRRRMDDDGYEEL